MLLSIGGYGGIISIRQVNYAEESLFLPKPTCGPQSILTAMSCFVPLRGKLQGP